MEDRLLQLGWSLIERILPADPVSKRIDHPLLPPVQVIDGLCEPTRGAHALRVLGVILMRGRGLAPDAGPVRLRSPYADRQALRADWPERAQLLAQCIRNEAEHRRPGEVLLVQSQDPHRGLPCTTHSAVARAVEHAVERQGIVVVLPAGNGNARVEEHTPALVVGGRGANGMRWPHSSHGPGVHAWGPAVGVATTDRRGGRCPSFGGTSAAAAVVAGQVLLLQQASLAARGALLGPAQVRIALDATCRSPGDAR